MIFDIKNRSKELGHSNYFKIIEKHNNSFVVIEDKLRDFFKEYKNRNKIITLLGIWLYFIRALYESYGEKGLQSFLDSDYDCVNRFAYKYEYGLSINNKIKNIKRTKPFIFLDLFLEKPLLPGGIVTSLIHKLKWRFTHLIIAFTPIKSSSKRKNELNLYISEYFNDLSIDKENYKNISELIKVRTMQDIQPFDEKESHHYLQQKEKINQQENTQRAYLLAKQIEESNKINKNVVSKFNYLTN